MIEYFRLKIEDLRAASGGFGSRLYEKLEIRNSKQILMR